MKANPNARHTQEAAGCKERKRKTLITKSKNSKCAESKKWQVAKKTKQKTKHKEQTGAYLRTRIQKKKVKCRFDRQEHGEHTTEVGEKNNRGRQALKYILSGR